MPSAPRDKNTTLKNSPEENSLDQLEEQFGALFGDDVEPLNGKGAAYVPKSAQVTPGVLARRKAAQLEMQADGNFLDPETVIPQVQALDPGLFSSRRSTRRL